MQTPMWPIIYVRGYAMTRGEIDETTADPFCGFNLGSTVYRATSDKNRAKKFVFESPLVRIGREYGYTSVYNNGLDIVDPDWTAPSIPPASVIIFRYYDGASNLLGSGVTPPITEFAEQLGKLILRVRDLVCADDKNPISTEDFRCYLVAHSMGGLVCRTFLQNPRYGTDEARRYIDKFFTYATPHNGIEMAGINVPSFLSVNEINNFNRSKMAEYLDLRQEFAATGRVDWIPERAAGESLSARRIFCMIGTNRADYDVASGLSRTFVGNGSDGLVRIDNASVWGRSADGRAVPCATAYTYRSHSGYFGIVNSEEAYQNLSRFLFGNARVDVWADITEVRLPKNVVDAASGRNINAVYQFEILASPRGVRWYLTRRVAEEDSVACRTLEQLTSTNEDERSVYLSTTFLSSALRMNIRRPTLAYAVTLGVRVPDYEIEQSFFADDHIEGGYLYRDTILLEIDPSDQTSQNGGWQVKTSLSGSTTFPITRAELASPEGKAISIPFSANTSQGTIAGALRFQVSKWN